MAYDETLAERIRSVVGARPDIEEKKMFGGLCFLLDGKMFVGIVKDELMIRVGTERTADVSEAPYVRPMDFSGRPMQGFFFVEAPGCATVASVRPWVEMAQGYVATLEKKPKKAKPKKPRAGRSPKSK